MACSNAHMCTSKVFFFPFPLFSPVVILRALLQTRQYPSQEPLQAWLQSLSQGQVVGLIEPQQHRLHRHSGIGE